MQLYQERDRIPISKDSEQNVFFDIKLLSRHDAPRIKKNPADGCNICNFIGAEQVKKKA